MQSEIVRCELKQQYADILSKIDFIQFDTASDDYSGVFLTEPSASYFSASTRVMLVGRETAGWNTDNNKNTINRIHSAMIRNEPNSVIDESLVRYKKHVADLIANYGKPQKSHFRRFQNKLATHFEVAPDAILYCNLLAWDYKKASPLNRPDAEKSEIVRASVALLAAQIREYKPDIIVFATGCSVDKVIKQLFTDEFNGWDTQNVIPRQLWEFSAAESRCFRIAHPRASAKVHQAAREHLLTLL